LFLVLRIEISHKETKLQFYTEASFTYCITTIDKNFFLYINIFIVEKFLF
jgi:hypothetical protein